MTVRNDDYNAALYQRLRAQRCPVAPPPKQSELAKIMSLGDSQILEHDCGVACISWVAIVAIESFRLEAFDIVAPWPNGYFEVLPSPPSKGKYVIPGTRITYHYHDVLNHYAEEWSNLQRGQRLEGWLVANAIAHSVPAEYRRAPRTKDAKALFVEISLYDTLERRASAEIASVYRSCRKIGPSASGKLSSPSSLPEDPERSSRSDEDELPQFE